MPLYQYRPLSKKPDSIRLLRLLPAANHEAEIRAELLEYNLDEFHGSSHSYEALSYVWGDLSKTRSIFLDDVQFGVTSNLHAAFLQLRDHSFPRIIWIDAICINQSDDDERELQIQSMAKIYGNAKRVNVWLGEAADSSDEALEAIRTAGMKSEKFPKGGAIEKSVSLLLQREWFERVWVLQEVAAARHVVIICGTTEIDGYAFCSGLEHPVFRETHSNGRYARVRAVTSLIQGAIFRPRFTSSAVSRTTLNIHYLGELMSMYNTHKATLRHDKIYALIGMATEDVSDAGLLPDYDVPWEDLLQRLFHFVLGNNIHSKTSPEEEKVEICGRGYVIGRVMNVTGTTNGKRKLDVKFNDSFLCINPDINSSFWQWNIPVMANDVQYDDIIYLLEETSKPMIIRPCGDYYYIIAIIGPHGHIIGSAPFLRSISLIWDWAKFPDEVVEAKRNWTTALILKDMGYLRRAKDMISKLISDNVEVTDLEFIEVMEYSRWNIGDELLDQMGHTICITEDVLIAIISNQTKSVIAHVLKERKNEVQATEAVLRVAASNVHCLSPDIMTTLLDCCDNAQTHISEAVLDAAARSACPEATMQLLLDRKGPQTTITKTILVAAVGNASCPKATMQLLLERRGPEINITEAIIVAAVGNTHCTSSIIQLLLDHKDLTTLISEPILLAAATNPLLGEQNITLLLTHTNEPVPITEPVLAAAARNSANGLDILRYIFAENTTQVHSPDAVAPQTALAGNKVEVNSPEGVAPQTTPIHATASITFPNGITTPAILEAVVSNDRSGTEILQLLLDQTTGTIQVTQPVVAAAARNIRWRSKLLRMLYRRNEDVLGLWVSMGGRAEELCEEDGERRGGRWDWEG